MASYSYEIGKNLVNYCTQTEIKTWLSEFLRWHGPAKDKLLTFALFFNSVKEFDTLSVKQWPMR